MRVGGIITTSGLEKRRLSGTQKGSQSDFFFANLTFRVFFLECNLFFLRYVPGASRFCGGQDRGYLSFFFFFEC